MRFAFCLFRYFPYSGLARDMARIADEVQRRGHRVVVFTTEWEGLRPERYDVQLIAARGLSNHGRANGFYRALRRRLSQEEFDAVIGFNKMPGLDLYYAADDCYVARARRAHGVLYRLTPRFRRFSRFEHAVFAPHRRTIALLLSERAIEEYREFYCTPDERLRLLPPTLGTATEQADAVVSPAEIRRSLGLAKHDKLVLLVGSGFKTKGVDRAIRALAALPDGLRAHTVLVVIGQGDAKPYARMATLLQVADRLHFLGGRDDVRSWLRSADLLLHPAYNETAGMILLEALVCGLPVLTTDVCGYAPHIVKARAGVVVPSPFSQATLNRELARMLCSTEHETWRENAIEYSARLSPSDMPRAAADAIEHCAARANAPVGGPMPMEQPRDGCLYLRRDLRDGLGPTDRFDDIMAIAGTLYREAPGRRTVRFTRAGKAYFLKAHTGIGWREIFKNLSYLRLPVLGAGNEWHAIHRLRRLGIDTMTIAGYGVAGSNPARRRSFIITDEIASTQSLEDLAARWREAPPRRTHDLRMKRRLIRRLAEIARTLHSNGANHRDFYLCHFLLDDSTRGDDPPRLYLIDLHRMQLRRHTPLRWRIKDIAGLYYSSMRSGLTRRDLYRFMTHYQDAPLRTILQGEQRFWRRVRRRALRLDRAERRAAPRGTTAAGATISNTAGR